MTKVSPDNREHLSDHVKSINGFNAAQRCDTRVVQVSNLAGNMRTVDKIINEYLHGF